MTDPAAPAARASDGLVPSTDPGAYVPRLALEAALAELSEVIGKTLACAALSGETGLGKTLLLHVLRERLLGAFECLYVPFPRLEAAELWRWAASALGLGAGEDDRGAVLGRARRLRDEGSGLVLLVDDAGALPPATRADLLAALGTSGLSLVLALASEDQAQLASLPPWVRRVDVGPPMTLAETRAYVHAQLRRVDPSGTLAARLTADRLAALHDASGGVPARLHPLLDAWLSANEPAEAAEPVELPEAPREEPPGAARQEMSRALRAVSERLERPAVRFTLLGLALAATLTAWLFAWQKGPGMASVGVPVEPPAAESAPPAPDPVQQAPDYEPLAPALRGEASDVAAEPPLPEAAPAEVGPEAAAPVEAGPAPEAPTSSRPARAAPATAARRPARPLAPALPALPPRPDPSRAEAPVHVSSPRFPEEHVPALVEDAPLGAPPAGPRLNVNARPWAAISLDGTPVGETPLGELRVSPGPHVVSAHLPDGRVVERTVEARAGDVYVTFP